jgi:ABC-type Mn2+/Zn2+ transport system permease subunit
MSLLSLLAEPLQHAFMRNAFAAIVLVGLICGAMGVFVTLRGLAFMGDAIAHAVFPGVVISYVAGGSFLVGAILAATIVSLAIGAVTQSGLLRNDTAIGVFFVGAFALGVAIISTRDTYARDVTSLLFGSILGVANGDLALTAVVGGGVLIALWLFRREIVTLSFDRTFARSQGLNLWGWDQLFLLLLSLTIVVSLQTVGNVLVLAMLVTPAASARLLTVRLGRMIAVSALIGAACGVAGLYASYYQGVSSGASIVLVATAVFVAVFLFAPGTGAITSRIARRLHFAHPERDQFLDANPAVTSPSPGSDGRGGRG